MKLYELRNNPGLNRAFFDDAKASGYLNRGFRFEMRRLSLDGDIVLVEGPDTEPAAWAGKVLWSGTPEEWEMRREANLANWYQNTPAPDPVVQPAVFRADVIDPEPMPPNRLLKWIAAAAVAGGIGYGIYSLKGNSHEAPPVPAPQSESNDSGK